jgi:hypothetical protein
MGGQEKHALRRAALIAKYPGLANGHFEIKSPQDSSYNCAAFAAEDTRRNWHPHAWAGLYWPTGEQEDNLQSWIEGFAALGYVRCESPSLESGIEKVAIYALDGWPQHIARQRPDGIWVSKMGPMEDMEHSLEGLEGELYGSLIAILARPLGGQQVLPL